MGPVLKFLSCYHDGSDQFLNQIVTVDDFGFTSHATETKCNQCVGLVKATKRPKNSSMKCWQKSFRWLSFGTIRESSSKSTLKEEGWMRQCIRKLFASSGEQFKINREARSTTRLSFFTVMQGCILQKLYKIYCPLSTGMFSYLTSLHLISTNFHIWRLNLVVRTLLVLPQW